MIQEKRTADAEVQRCPRKSGCCLLWGNEGGQGVKPCDPLWSMGEPPTMVIRIGHGQTGRQKGQAGLATGHGEVGGSSRLWNGTLQEG